MPPRQPTAGARDPLGSIVPSGSKNSDADAPGIMAAEERAAGVEPGLPSSTGSVTACPTLASESPADSPGGAAAHTENKELAKSTRGLSSRKQPKVAPPAEQPEIDFKGRGMRKRAREPEQGQAVPEAGAQARVTDVSQHQGEGGKAASGPAASGDVAGPCPCGLAQLFLCARLPLVTVVGDWRSIKACTHSSKERANKHAGAQAHTCTCAKAKARGTRTSNT